jgi:hypothetical protein
MRRYRHNECVGQPVKSDRLGEGMQAIDFCPRDEGEGLLAVVWGRAREPLDVRSLTPARQAGAN